jgi:ribonuclease P protein component
MTTTYRFLPRMHLRKSEDFERVYELGKRAGDAHLLVFALANALEYSRLGMSVSRKHGPAVVRNLKRRRMREAFRLSAHQLPAGLDLVVIPRFRTDSTLDDYHRSLSQLVRQVARRLSLPNPDSPSLNRATVAGDSGEQPT